MDANNDVCLLGFIRHYYKQKNIKNCESIVKRNDTLQDHNKINQQLWFRYSFKILRDFNSLFILSFFVGCFFYIFSDLTRESFENQEEGSNLTYFIEKWKIDE